MWWKIYFWVVLILSVIGILILAKDISNFNLGDWLGSASNILVILAVYSLVFKKEVLAPKWWKVILWILIINVIIEFEPTGTLNRTLTFLHPNVTKASTGEMFFQLLIAAPALYAMYKLGYKK